MLGKEEAFDSIPYFWTVMFGKSLRYCGKAEWFSSCSLICEHLTHHLHAPPPSLPTLSSCGPVYIGFALSWDEIIYEGNPEEQAFAAFFVK